MSKSKKPKTPKIDPRVVTRPRLETLFDRHARSELDDDGLQAGLERLMAEVGHGPVLDALVKRMEGTPENERDTLLTVLPRLRKPEVIDYLWQLVKKPKAMSVEAKLTTLVILKQMGEDVDIRDPGLYISPRDIKPGDIESAENMFRMGMRGLARMLRDARDPAEAEAYMHRINKMPESAIDGENVLLEMVRSAEAGATDLDADFLHALAFTTPFPNVQQTAERALARLATAGILPVTRAILDLSHDQFYAAHMTDPNHPWQQNVTVAWLPAEWLQDYLASLDPDPEALDELDPELEMITESWLDLRDLINYIDNHAYEIHTLADLHCFHLEDCLAESTVEWDEDDTRDWVDSIADFFTYLAQRSLIPSDLPFLAELAQIVARKDELTLNAIPLPPISSAPKGGSRRRR